MLMFKNLHGDSMPATHEFASRPKGIKCLMPVDASCPHDKINLFGDSDISNGVTSHAGDLVLFAGCKHTDIVAFETHPAPAQIVPCLEGYSPSILR